MSGVETIRETIRREHERRAREVQTLRDAMSVTVDLMSRFTDGGTARKRAILNKARKADDALGALIMAYAPEDAS